jgi:hypothetical protein
MRSGDVEEDQLIGPLSVIALRQLHRIPRIAQPNEVGPLHNAPSIDIKARNNPLENHAHSLKPG